MTEMRKIYPATGGTHKRADVDNPKAEKPKEKSKPESANKSGDKK